MTDPEERLLIQSRDMIIMQFRLQDSIAQYFSNAVHLPMSYILAKGPRFFSTPTATFP
jgi:hypothetical protein